jgi:integrase
MGRPRKQNREPFWRTERNCWYVQHGTRQIRLSPDKDEAWRLWHEFMARPPEEERPLAPGPDVQAIEVLDDYLDWCQKNKAPRTYQWYRENIQRFAIALPDGLRVADLKPFHLTRAMDAFAHWANNTKHDFISAVKRAFSWAEAEGLIDRNPLAHVRKPAREVREMAISPSEYATIIEAIREPGFRDLIELTWECGARPQEIRNIEARFFDAENSRIIFPPKEAKGKKYYRIIYLTPRASDIVARLAEANPHGALLLNSDGNPWTKDAINCAFCRLEKKLGRKYHLGAFRKGYATEALKAGIDTVTVAHLLGHRDPSMVSRVYGQVQNDPQHMASAALRAKRNGAAHPGQLKKSRAANPNVAAGRFSGPAGQSISKL